MYRVSDALQDRWPPLPYVVPDGSKELTIAFASRGLRKFCDLLTAGQLSAEDQVTVLRQCAVRISTPEYCEGDDAWRLATLSLQHIERGPTPSVRLAASRLLGRLLSVHSAVIRAIAADCTDRIVAAIDRETDAQVRRSSVAALACITSRAEGASDLAARRGALCVLVACVAKTSDVLHLLADVAADTAGARAVLAAGAVPAVVAFLRSAATGGAAPASSQPDAFYPVLKARDESTDALEVLRTIAEHDPGRVALLSAGAPPVLALWLRASPGVPARTLIAALGAVSALAGSVPGVHAVLKESAAALAVELLTGNCAPSVAEQALSTLKQLVAAPAGRRSVCAVLVTQPLLLLRVLPPPAPSAAAELVELLQAPPGTDDTLVSATLGLLLSIADPGSHFAGPEAAAAAISAMSRASCKQRLRDISNARTASGDSPGQLAAARAARLLTLLQ